MTKRTLLPVLLITMLHFQCLAQVSWVKDEKFAKGIAAANDQLILIDFWASWCGPCKTMDRQLWNDPGLSTLSQKIIPLKVNVDNHKSLAIKYNITSIPRVLIVTINGDILWDKVGFSGPEDFLEIFEQIPKSLNGLNQQLLNSEELTAEENYQIGLDMQALARQAEGEFKEGFLRLSDRYLKKAEKTNDSNELANLAIMNALLNDAYKGKYKKAIKKIRRLAIPAQQANATDLKAFVLAYCFKCNDNYKEFITQKAKINNKDYLNRLE